MINKDFLKDIFAERKFLMPLQQLKVVVVPKYDEISVKSIYPQVQRDPDLMKYFPDNIPKGRQPDREYMFNILNTKRPDFVAKIVTHAQKLRNAATDESKQSQYIQMTEGWQQQLEAVPFVSSKLCDPLTYFRVAWNDGAPSKARQQEGGGSRPAKEACAGRQPQPAPTQRPSSARSAATAAVRPLRPRRDEPQVQEAYSVSQALRP